MIAITSILVGLGVLGVAALLSVAGVWAVMRFTKSKAAAIAIGSLVVPVGGIFTGFMDVSFNLAVDDPAPGMLLLGYFISAAVVLPITLLVSVVTVRILTRRADRTRRTPASAPDAATS